MDLREIFAANLRRLRLAQDDLAYQAGVSRSYLSQLSRRAIPHELSGSYQAVCRE
jgi:hypothetical protein